MFLTPHALESVRKRLRYVNCLLVLKPRSQQPPPGRFLAKSVLFPWQKMRDLVQKQSLRSRSFFGSSVIKQMMERACSRLMRCVRVPLKRCRQVMRLHADISVPKKCKISWPSSTKNKGGAHRRHLDTWWRDLCSSRLLNYKEPLIRGFECNFIYASELFVALMELLLVEKVPKKIFKWIEKRPTKCIVYCNKLRTVHFGCVDDACNQCSG